MSKPAANLRANTGGTWNRRVALLGLSLLVILPLTFTALDHLVPKVSSRGPGASTRAGWYLRSGQWHADIRTLVAAFAYVIDSDTETTAAINPPTKQLVAPSRPVGSNPPAMTQVKGDGNHFPNS